MQVSPVVPGLFARSAAIVAFAGTVASYSACTADRTPALPAVSPTEYQKGLDEWRAQRMTAFRNGVGLRGIWELVEGNNPFGADSSLPIVLPGSNVPARAGLVRKHGAIVEILRDPGFAGGSLRFDVVGDDDVASLRRWLTVSDDAHPSLDSLRPFETFPVSMEWRVAARFRAFSEVRSFAVANMTGGTTDVLVPGELVFRAGSREYRLIAMQSTHEGKLYVMFRDATSGVTTYGGFRTLEVDAPSDGAWTVLDFNLAENPPCSYSKLLACPLPPVENRIVVAVEAGEKRPPGIPEPAGTP